MRTLAIEEVKSPLETYSDQPAVQESTRYLKNIAKVRPSTARPGRPLDPIPSSGSVTPVDAEAFATATTTGGGGGVDHRAGSYATDTEESFAQQEEREPADRVQCSLLHPHARARDAGGLSERVPAESYGPQRGGHQGVLLLPTIDSSSFRLPAFSPGMVLSGRGSAHTTCPPSFPSSRSRSRSPSTRH